MGRRHQGRQLALKVLFQLEGAAAPDLERELRYHVQTEEGAGLPGSVVDFARELIRGVLANQPLLNREIRQASRNWELEQMAKMDRIILRIAVYEILIARNVPVKAAINESIELAKEFSGEDSSKFVNGILGKIALQRSSGRDAPAPA